MKSMKIRDFLSASDAAIDVRANDKASLLKLLAGRAAAALGLPKFRTRDASRILRCSRQIGELEPHQGWSPDTRELEEMA